MAGIALLSVLNSPAQAPDVPQNVQGAWISQSGGAAARLNWDGATNVTGYKIYRYNEQSNAWDTLATVPVTNLFFDAPVGPGVSYYSVSALNESGESSGSATTVVQSGEGGGFNVDFPEVTFGSLTPTNALVVWHAYAWSGVDGMLEWGLSPTNLDVVGFNSNYQLDHGYYVSNLVPATVYYYRITSVGTNRAGVSELYSLQTPDTNHPPVAADVIVGLASEYGMNVTLSCSDANDPPSPFFSGFTFTVTVPPTNGYLDALVISSSPIENQVYVYYTPNPGARGDDHFQYVANDGELSSASATVTITNIFLNRWPEATSLSTNILEDVPLNLVLSGIDADGDELTFTVDGVVMGSVSGTPPNLTYTPAADFHGEDQIIFSVTDGYSPPMSGVITVTIDPVNDAPAVQAQEVTISEDEPAYVFVDSTDVEYDVLTFTVAQEPAHGTIESDGSALFVYTPAGNYSGPDSFVVIANDGESNSAPATVSLTIQPVNDPPTANDAQVNLSEDASANIALSGGDTEGSPVTFQVTQSPTHGTLSGTPPNLIYTPAVNFNGDDYFTFVTHDGVNESAPGFVAITVTPLNDAPVAQPQSLSTSYNASAALTLTGSDVEGSALSFEVLTSPGSGTLTGTAPNLTFTPSIGFTGAVSLTFRVNDGGLNSTPATVAIAVQPPVSVPPSPTGLTATAVSSSQINLAWTDNSALEDGFKIERSLNNSSWTQIATVGRNVTTFASTGLAANKTYYYRVRAHNVLGNSPYSNTASAKTLK